MRKLLFVAVAAAVFSPLVVLAFAPAPDADSKPVDYQTWNGYAERDESGLKGSDSLLVFTQRSDFYRVFEPVLTPRGMPDAVPRDAFDGNLFVAVIKRGDVFWDYKVERVAAAGDTLTVSYRATVRKGDAPRSGGTAKDYSTRIGVRTTEKRVEFITTEKRAAGSERAPITTEKVITTARARTTEKAPAATEKGITTERVKTTEKALPATTARARFTTEKKYATSGRDGDLAAVVDSSLILSVLKGKYASVTFVENGRKVGTVRVGN